MTHGRGQPCGDCGEGRNIRGLSGNGKNTIKNKKIKGIAPLAQEFICNSLAGAHELTG